MRFGDYLSLLIILILAILLRLHIINNIYINDFITQPLLITDLLGKGIVVPWRIIFLSDLCNIFLMFFIGRKLVNIKFGLISALIYGISPWIVYSQLFGSLNIFLLQVFLIFISGLIMLKGKTAFLVIIFSCFILLFSSILSLLILPVLMIGLYTIKVIDKSRLKNLAFILSIALLPIFVLAANNTAGIKNIYRNQINIFSDPGLINTINAFQGETRKAGFTSFAKWSENKYLYLSKYLLLKTAKNIVPSTYFTSQEKLFSFSFSVPIYTGFLIPFFYGLYLVIKSRFISILVFIGLIIPSVLSKQLVDLDRLIFIAPVVIFLISYGIIKLYERRKKTVFKLLLILCIFVTVLQLVVTISDIDLREPLRYKLSVGQDITK